MDLCLSSNYPEMTTSLTNLTLKIGVCLLLLASALVLFSCLPQTKYNIDKLANYLSPGNSLLFIQDRLSVMDPCNIYCDSFQGEIFSSGHFG